MRIQIETEVRENLVVDLDGLKAKFPLEYTEELAAAHERFGSPPFNWTDPAIVAQAEDEFIKQCWLASGLASNYFRSTGEDCNFSIERVSDA